MENTVDFFNRKLTKEEWDNPELLLKFSNTEILSDAVNLLDGFDEMIEELQEQYGISSTRKK